MWTRIRSLLWVACAAFAMRACVLEPVRLTDDSMRPVFADGDVGFACKLCYGLRVPGAGAVLLEWRAPRKGDLVVAAAVGDPPVTLLRRVAAVPGERARLEDGQVITLAPGEYFLTADKREGTLDSRKMGPVPRRAIIGRVTHGWIAETPSKESGSRIESGEPARRSLHSVL